MPRRTQKRRAKTPALAGTLEPSRKSSAPGRRMLCRGAGFDFSREPSSRLYNQQKAGQRHLPRKSLRQPAETRAERAQAFILEGLPGKIYRQSKKRKARATARPAPSRSNRSDACAAEFWANASTVRQAHVREESRRLRDCAGAGLLKKRIDHVIEIGLRPQLVEALREFGLAPPAMDGAAAQEMGNDGHGQPRRCGAKVSQGCESTPQPGHFLLFYKDLDWSGWGGRIRTYGWRNQNPLPYHLATPQSFSSRWRTIIGDPPARKRATVIFLEPTARR